MSQMQRTNLLKSGCLLRAIHHSFQLTNLSEEEFFQKAIESGACDSECFVDHEAMCRLLKDLTGKTIHYHFSLTNPKNAKSHVFKCFSKSGLTHFVEVNLDDDVLFDSVYNSVLRRSHDSCSYRCYDEF